MFWKQIVLYGVVLASALPILVWYAYAKDRLALRWRKWHTEKTLVDYFACRNYYEIDQEKTVDNPDQRIADDINTFSSTSLTLFMSVFSSAIDLVNFSLILISIYPKLFIVLISYSTVGTVIAVFVGRRLINLNFMQLQKEADFRYSLIRVRENAESIAFYNGEPHEKFETERRFTFAVENMVDLIVWTRNLAFFTTSYSYLIQILPLSIIAPLYFAGSIELGVVSQSQQAFLHILDDLSLIVNEFERLSAFSAGVDRLGELEEFLYDRFAKNDDRLSIVAKGDPSDEPHSPNNTTNNDDGGFDTSDSDPTVHWNELDSDLSSYLAQNRQDAINRFRCMHGMRSEDEMLLDAEGGAGDVHITTVVNPAAVPRIAVENLTLMTPDKKHRVLFEKLSFTVEHGQRLLIVGPSGTGKSSALRALAGLWNNGRGTIKRPKLNSMFFLPQKPYCTLGSLKEQLVYPTPLEQSTVTEKELLIALELVNLQDLPERMGGFDERRDWSNTLSLGEQQRLAFARLVIGKPDVAILDECSSALDVASEDKLYSYLRRTEIGYISVGHRPSLFKYHDVVLHLGMPGRTYELKPITPEMQG